MMKAIFVLAAVIAVAFCQDPCTGADHNTCQTCTQDTTNNCGWCAATQQCLKGSGEGPDGSVCIGNNWMWGKSSCSECDMTVNKNIVDCESCLDYPNCCWSETTKSCNLIGFTGGCSSTTCPCSTYGSCSQCINEGRQNCNWCTALDQCVESTAQCSSPTLHSCPCGDNQDCAACRASANCAWCSDAPADGRNCIAKGSTNGCKIALTCEAYCNNAPDCLTCDGLPGCGWCEEKGQCVDASFSSCLLVHSCFKPCNNIGDCQECVGRSDCGWCNFPETVEGACVDSNAKPDGCLISHTCIPVNPSSGGFDAGSFVGGMFLVAGLVVLGAGGFIFYRRQQAHSNYAQVN